MTLDAALLFPPGVLIGAGGGTVDPGTGVLITQSGDYLTTIGGDFFDLIFAGIIGLEDGGQLALETGAGYLLWE